MNTVRIKQKLENEFRPFAIQVSSGKRYVVPHPDFVMVGKSVVAVMDLHDNVTTIDALHIVAVEDIPQQSKHKKAGAP